MPKKKWIILAAIIILFLLAYMSVEVVGNLEIRQIATEIKNKSPDEKTTILNLLEWEKLVMHPTWNEPYDFWTIFGRFFYPDNPSFIILTKRGHCGEYAALFNEIAKSVGIPSRRVRAPGNNHEWNEVMINGSWVHADSTLDSPSNFNHPDFYERQDGYNWKLSYIDYIDSKGDTQDITNNYTETGTLIVRVGRDGSPIRDAEVIIKKEAFEAINNYTDSDGIARFNLGGNNYSVIAEQDILLGRIIGYRNETVVGVEENSTRILTVYPTQLGLLTNFYAALLIVILIVSVLWYVIIIRKSKQLVKRRK